MTPPSPAVRACLRRSGGIAAALLALVGGAGPASAQLKPVKPLFRASNDPENSRDKLDVFANGFAGWSRVTGQALFQPNANVYEGAYYGGNGTLFYTHKGEQVEFGASGGGSIRAYTAFDNRTFPTLWQGTTTSIPLSRRTTFRVRESITYTGYYAYNPTPDADIDSASLEPPSVDFFLDNRHTIAFSGGGDLEHKFSERSTLTGGYNGRYVDLSGQGYDATSHHANIRYNRRMTENATLNLGYTYNQWSYPGYGGSLRSHDVNVGVAYSRPLASSRRTRVGFDVSSSINTDQGSSRFRLNGGGFVTHQYARTWSIAGIYRRRNEVVEGFAFPFFLYSDAFTVSLGGQLARRAALSTYGSWAYGTYSVDTLENTVRTLSAGTTVSVAMFSFLSGYAQTGVARNDFETRLGLLEGVPSLFKSFWVSGGLTIALPLVR